MVNASWYNSLAPSRSGLRDFAFHSTFETLFVIWDPFPRLTPFSFNIWDLIRYLRPFSAFETLFIQYLRPYSLFETLFSIWDPFHSTFETLLVIWDPFQHLTPFWRTRPLIEIVTIESKYCIYVLRSLYYFFFLKNVMLFIFGKHIHRMHFFEKRDILSYFSNFCYSPGKRAKSA